MRNLLLIRGLAGLAAAAILAHLALGYWSFPYTDDIVFVGSGLGFGFTKAFWTLWDTHNGRFASTPLIMAIYRSEYAPYLTPWLVIAVLAVFIAALSAMFRKLGGAGWRIACIDAAFLLLILPPDVKEAGIYWLGAGFTYLLPISGLLIIVALIDRPATPGRERWIAAALFSASFVIAGFNEQFDVLLIILLAGYLPILRSGKENRLLMRLFIVMLGVEWGLFIDALSPGNHMRHEDYILKRGYETPLSDILSLTLESMTRSIPPILIPAVAYGLLRANAYPLGRALPKTDKLFFFWLLTIFAALFASFLIIVYGYNGRVPTNRALLTPFTALFMIALFSTGWASRIWALPERAARLPARFRRALLLCLAVCAALPLPSGYSGLAASLERAPEEQRAGLIKFDEVRAQELKKTRRDNGL